MGKGCSPQSQIGIGRRVDHGVPFVGESEGEGCGEGPFAGFLKTAQKCARRARGV